MREIIGKINAGTYENKTIENLLLQLARQLSATTGKKQYGYLNLNYSDDENPLSLKSDFILSLCELL